MTWLQFFILFLTVLPHNKPHVIIVCCAVLAKGKPCNLQREADYAQMLLNKVV